MEFSSAINFFAVIVGAGPAGLCMANLLKAYGKKFVLIERMQKFDKLSKSTSIHGNTLRLFEKINIAHNVSSQAIDLLASRNYVNEEFVQEVKFQSSKEPNHKNINISQFALRTILAAELSEDEIQFGKTLENFEQQDQFVTADIRENTTNKIIKLYARYLIACDGAKSSIRKKLDLKFDGERQPEPSFTFDARVLTSLEPNKMYIYTKGPVRLVTVPMSEGYKFYARCTDEWEKERQNSDWESKEIREDCVRLVKERSGLDIDIESVRGACFYHLAAKICSSMHERRVFLIGDAAHVFFPQGGYGQNTAIEDGFSLAWRLILAENESLKHVLDSFNHERLSNAQQIKDDSTQKKQQQENLTVNSSAPKKEKEVLVYAKTGTALVRLENVLSINVCQVIQSNHNRILFEIINKNLGFTILVNSQDILEARRLQNLVYSLKSSLTNMPIELVHVCDQSFDLSSFQVNDEYFIISPSTLFKDNMESMMESIIVIRPDNFISIVPLRTIESEFNLLA